MEKCINVNRTCVCSLPDMQGPDVCKNCLNNPINDQSWGTITNPVQWYPKTKKIKRITRTIEKYDAEGRFIGKEIITEEIENVEKQVWEPSYQFGTIHIETIGNVGLGWADDINSTITYKSDVPYTFTAMTNSCVKN